MSSDTLQEAVASLSSCARSIISPGLNVDGCDSNVACLCANTAFQTLVNFRVAQDCDIPEFDATLTAFRPLCVAALPWLDHSLEPLVLGITIPLMILATVSVGLRFLARRKVKAAFKIDDGFIVLALVVTYGLDAVNFTALHYGFGRHTWLLNHQQFKTFLKYDFAFQVLFALAVTIIKISILFFYNRIFTVRKFRFCAIAVGVLNILWCIIFIVGVSSASKPTAYFWDHTIRNGKGVNENPFGVGISVANVITDLLVLILPIPVLWGLQMKKEKKLAITGIFILGGFTCIAGVLRIPFLVRSKKNDISYTVVSVAVWVSVETNLGIVCACLPVMRPLFQRTVSALSSSKLSSIKQIFHRGSKPQSQAGMLEKDSSTGSTTLAQSEYEGGKSPLESSISQNDNQNKRLTAEWRVNSQYGGEMGLPANGQLSRLAHSSPWNKFQKDPMEEAGKQIK